MAEDQTAEEKAAAEQRRDPRKKVLRSGKAAFNAGGSVYDCQIWNISEHGAKLRFTDVTPMPKRFNLWISNGGHFVCEVRHVEANWIGVRFIEALPEAEALKIFGRLF